MPHSLEHHRIVVAVRGRNDMAMENRRATVACNIDSQQIYLCNTFYGSDICSSAAAECRAVVRAALEPFIKLLCIIFSIIPFHRAGVCVRVRV